MQERVENNQVTIVGEICAALVFNHEVYGEGFYTTAIRVNRLSEVVDEIPVMISERMLDVREDYSGCTVEITGQFRSFNKYMGERNRLVLHVFAKEIIFLEKIEDATNAIYLDGFICKPPVYRVTPKGRAIADLLIAVNRAYGRTDYIPCIAWGRNAMFAANYPTGSPVKVWGRIQSREYIKRLDEREEKRVAYEVSISRMEFI